MGGQEDADAGEWGHDGGAVVVVLVGGEQQSARLAVDVGLPVDAAERERGAGRTGGVEGVAAGLGARDVSYAADEVVELGVQKGHPGGPDDVAEVAGEVGGVRGAGVDGREHVAEVLGELVGPRVQDGVDGLLVALVAGGVAYGPGRGRAEEVEDVTAYGERGVRAAGAEKGTAGLRMSDIAERAGMSTGHILYHFGKKDRLLLEVLAWSQRDLWDRFQQAVDQAASPAEKLDLFVRFYLPRHQGDERYALWTQVLAQRHDDAGRAVLTELLDGWDARLAAILREGRDLGHFADVDLTEFTIRAVAMLSGLSEDVMFGRSRWQHASAHAFALTALERELRPAGQG